MAQVTFSVSARNYTIACPDDSEEYVLKLSQELDQRVQRVHATSPQGDSQALVLIALALLDELHEAKGTQPLKNNDNELDLQLLNQLKDLTIRIERLAKKLNSH